MQPRAFPHHTAADYLSFQAGSRQRHELVGGRIITQVDAGRRHGALSLNVSSGLLVRLGDRRCRPFPSDTRVAVSEGVAYVYPDVVVACPPFERREQSLVAPRVVVEVLSTSTARYDRETKTPLYRSIASVTDVLLVEQGARRVEHHRRVEADGWAVEVLTDGAVALRGLEVTLPLDEIYRGVDALPD